MSQDQKQLITTTILVSLITSSVVGFLSGGYAYDYLKTKGLVKGGETLQSGAGETVRLVKEESAIIDVVKKASPAVGNIIVTKDLPKIESRPFNPFDPFSGDIFDFFNRRQIQQKEPETEKQEIGGGTGFLISSDGLIVTNKHVVEDLNAEYTFLTNDEKRYSATVLARHPSQDLAILKIEGKKFPTLELGESSTIQIGQKVVAIGNALGEFRNTVSTGVVSGLARSIVAQGSLGGAERLNNIIQTDAAINSGNSGGPLLNLEGQVIGINTAIAQGAQNVGFAIPANMVKKSVEDVQKKGKIVLPYLGVRYLVINESIKQANNLSVDYGALILAGATQEELAVVPGSPADKAGIVPNDIILEMNGVKIDNDNPLANLLTEYNVGDTVTLKVLHRGEEREIEVELEERK